MAISYGLFNSFLSETVLGYFPASLNSYSGGSTLKSISAAAAGTSIYDINATNFQLYNNQMSLCSSEPTDASVPNLSLTGYGQLTFLLSTTAQCTPGDKKGAFFGISEGSLYYSPSTLNHVEDGHIPTNVIATVGIDATIVYTASTQQSEDGHVAVTNTAVTGTSGGIDTTITYAVSTQQSDDGHVAETNTAVTGTSGGIDTTIAYTASTQTTADFGNKTTTVTGTQKYADLAQREFIFKLDRGSRGLYAKLKDGDSETSVTVSFEPTSKDAIGVVFEKTPYNKISIYINGSLTGSSTTTNAISLFPTNSRGLRLFANGVSTDSLDGSIGSFMLFGRKLSDAEISKLSSNIILQGKL